MASLGRSPMPPDVRERVAERARGQLARMFGWLAAAPACVALGVSLAVATGPGTVSLIIGFLGAFIAPLACLLAAGDGWSRRGKLRRDLAGGEIETFEGSIVVVMGHDEALERLARQGALGTDAAASHRVVLLASSGLLHAVDGVTRDDFLVPDVLEVADAPPPRPIAPSRVAEPRPVTLTAEERAELATRSTQLWRTPAALIGPVAYAALGLTMWRVSGTAWLERYWVQLVIWGALGTLALVGLIRRYRTGALVAADGEAGEALEIVEAGDDGVLHLVVVLPRSGLVWSADGVPAAWRSKKL